MKCFKCGTSEGLIKHHLSYHPEQLVDCCKSCHVKIHRRVRKENKCSYSVKETHQLSKNSYRDRAERRISFYTSLCPGVQLQEHIILNALTKTVGFSAYIYATGGKELFYVDC